MRFTEGKIAGVYVVDLETHVDERGFFARTFCSDEFAAHGLIARFEQSSLSRNARRGTLRGMHFQADPHAEAKFVRCIRGAAYDVVVDLRRDSPTYRHWMAEVIDATSGRALYIPPGLAHGFQALEDDTDILYQITPAFRPGLGLGVRWNDAAFGIDWPLSAPILSERDANYPDWAE